MKSTLSLAILTSLFCSTLTFAATDLAVPQGGTVNVTVVDEHGMVVPDAPVYIYGEQKTHFVGGRNIPGTTTLSMKQGEYRISSALIVKSGDYVDRFASNEAHVQVVAGDNVSVILTLKPLHNDDQAALSYATLHVAGIPQNLINNN